MNIKISKVLASILILALMCSAFTACGRNQTEAETIVENKDSEIIDGIVSYFMPLTEIPRQSHHEENVSSYLCSWAQERGFSATRDEQNNVIFDVPGTEGMESAPMTVLQAHMDMVIAVKEGKQFDAQKDGITVINDGKTVTADGTSLGADDGMGVATILYFIDNNDKHGPIRVIFTTNEEDGMTGAFGLTPETVEGAKYVINLDSENSKEVTNSSAAGYNMRFSFTPEITAPQNTAAYKISVSGLLSGHSGVEIDKGRLNGIKALGEILSKIQNAGIDFELSSVTGGSALNAIPAKAEACIVAMPENEEQIKTIVSEAKDALTDKYGSVETGLCVDVENCDMPGNVLKEEYKNNVVKFVSNIFDGINSMSQYVDGLVESSSNIGLISVTADDSAASTAGSCVRSSDAEKLVSLTDAQSALAKECGFEAEVIKTADPWPVNPDSELLELVKTAYKEETGEDISVVQIHAGLETGTFSQLNPELDIVSIGFDITSPHTINETCYITTIPTTYKVLESVMANID